jgi:acetolactate synthase-1/2/3 large subunit
MSKLTGGQAVVQALVEEGIKVVFGLPGVQIMHLYDAFYNRSDIRVITTRHEQTTTYMADGYARVTGKPGVGLVVPGPGVQNASAGLGTAFSVSSPVLLLAGQIETAMIGRDTGALHEINDQLDIVRPVTKWCYRVRDGVEIPLAVHEAMRQMKTGRPRPTVLEIPPDILAKTAEVQFPKAEEYTPSSPDQERIGKATALLAKAQKPLIWAGGGTIISNASQEVLALAERLGAAVATTVEGKGIIPEDHPLSLGVGYYGHGTPARAASRADVVVAIGTRLTSQMFGPTRLRIPQRLIHIDVDPTVIGKNYLAEVAVVADAKMALQALLAEIPKRSDGNPAWSVQEITEAHRASRQWLEEKCSPQLHIISQIRQELNDDAIIISGITNVGYWGHLAYPVRKPGTYFSSSYFATLGFEFPTALGAKVAAPDRPVVCIVGDGGFMYGLPELATAVQYGINVILIVFVDNAFGASNNDQQTRFKKRVVGTELYNPSFAEVAQVFGAKGIKAKAEQVGKALREALKADCPTVIEVPMPTLPPPFQLPYEGES